MITPIQHAKQQKHTPGPVEVSDTSIVSGKYCIAVIEDDGGYEAPAEEREANAERLAHCWNSHDQLVEALQFVLSRLAPVDDRNQCTLYSDSLGPNDDQTVVEYLRAALLAATGKDTL